VVGSGFVISVMRFTVRLCSQYQPRVKAVGLETAECG